MSKKLFLPAILAILLLISKFAWAIVITDDFNTTHNYLTNGVAGTIWDGMYGTGDGESATEMSADANGQGRLYLASNGTRWAEPGDAPHGPFLYMNIQAENWIMIVRCVEYPTSGVAMNGWNMFGLMARASMSPDEAGPGEDYHQFNFFSVVNGINVQDINDNIQQYDLSVAPMSNYVRMTKRGAEFWDDSSSDGKTWTLHPGGDPYVRGDLDGLTLQIGLYQCNYSPGVNPGWGGMDNFLLIYQGDGQAWYLNPSYGELDVVLEPTFSWEPGTYVDSVQGHRLYYSDNLSLVQGRDDSVKVIRDTNSYMVPGPFKIATTYYWCVDEVNDASTTYSGDIWQFTTNSGKARNPWPGDYDYPQVVIDNKLRWTPFEYAVEQEFYFSDDPFNLGTAEILSGTAAEADIPSAYLPLVPNMTYYWRVDTNCGALGFAEGDLWSFTTGFEFTICDNFNWSWDLYKTGLWGTIWDGLLGWEYLTDLNTDYNDGKLYMRGGNCSWSGDQTGILLYKEFVGPFLATVEVANYPGLYGTPQVMHAWCALMARVGDVDAAGPGEDWIAIAYFPIWGNGNRGDLNGWYDTNYSIYFGRTMTGFAGGRYLQIDYKGDGIFYLRWSRDGEIWYPLNEDDEPIIDGHQVTVNPTIREDMAGLPLQVGIAACTYSANIAAFEFEDFCVGREATEKAYGPNPPIDGGLDIFRGVLSWSPGDFIYAPVMKDTQVVYFGTDYNDVNDANSSDPEYRGSINVIGPLAGSSRYSYNASQYENLAVGQKYYWRIDEVNTLDPQTWKGDVWNFTVLDYAVIDNFEKYTATGFPVTAGTLRKTWIDGYWGVQIITPTPGTSGSWVQLAEDTSDGLKTWTYYNGENIYRTGAQAMKFYYDNTDDGYTAPNNNKVWWMRDLYNYMIQNWYPAPMYSEVRAAIDDAARITPATQSSLGLRRDWSGFKLLKLSFYGDPNNSVLASDKLYVGLADGADIANPAVVTLSHSLTKSMWQDVYIPLQGTGSFKAAKPALDLSNIARIHIGIGNKGTPTAGGQGNIFIDDVQLLAYGICIPGSVTGDFTSDCQVDKDDLEAFMDGWQGEMPTLPAPIIDLSASALPYGPLLSWLNTGTLGGVFDDFDNLITTDNPRVEIVDGKKAVTFDGDDILIWKDTVGGVIETAPATLTSDRSEPNDYTIIAEVYNPSVADEEYYFAWAREGDGPGRSASLDYGTNDWFGAVVHWDWPDMGFGTASGRFTTPSASNWHTVAVTYRHPQGTRDGTETVVVDGVIREIEDKDLNIRQNDPVTIGNRYSIVNNVVTPNASFGFTGSVASIRIYAGYYPPEDIAILMGTPLDLHLPKNNVIDFKDYAMFANNWLVGPILYGE